MTKSASEALLGELHSLLTGKFIELLKREPITTLDADGAVIDIKEMTSPALLAAVAKFLKDNDITATDDVERQHELAAHLASKRQRKAIGNVVPIFDDED